MPSRITNAAMDKAWELIQKKTFTKWVNTKLDLGGVPHIQDLCIDMANGVRLIQLLEIIGDVSMGRYSMNPRMRIQCVENVNTALEFVKQRGVPLTNIGAEDIVDKNLKLVLGMLWMIILRFTIADINQDGKSAKEGLLLWCQRKTEPYRPTVNVRDFTYSWKDGLAFCALIHRHRPDLLDFYSLDFNDPHTNTALAFDIAEKHLGIPKLLDVEDVCDISKPDERSIMTYVAEYFHAFSSRDKVDTAGRRVAKFADVLQSVWKMQHDYEERVLALITAVRKQQKWWKDTRLADSYMDAKNKAAEFASYKNTTKREWISEKRDLDTLLGNIQTKLKTYNLRPYHPPDGHTLSDLDNVWKGLLQDEAMYHRRINSKIRQIKENLRKAYAQSANDFQTQLDTISNELSCLDGDLNSQLDKVMTMLLRVPPLQSTLKSIAKLDKECLEANIEENDYTVYSVEDLTFELELVERAIQKKKAFIQNQIVSRNMTNLTPAQLEEFEHAFRHFANIQTNTLSFEGFIAALASLGLIYQETEIDLLFDRICEGAQEATFAQFIRFMVSITEDNSTAEQLQDAFQTIAGEKPYVTELDLQMCMIPQSAIDYLKQDMPCVQGGETDAYDYALYVDQMFN